MKILKQMLLAVLLSFVDSALADDEFLDSLQSPTESGTSEQSTPQGVASDSGPLAVIPVPNTPAAPADTRPAPTGRVLEEIVVTAQKREQGLSEVPISISAFDEKFLADHAISDFRDLSLFVPNARIDANGTLPQLSIRGFNAHPLNRAFEQAITLVVDGVTYGTSPFFQLPLYDIGRVEVLRGPQGTLFGKNSTAGAFNISTRAAASAELEGNLSVQGGELERQRVELGVGGPIGDVGHWRVAGLYDRRDGILSNTTAETVPTANDRMNSRDRRAARLKLAFGDVGGVNVRASAETVDLKLNGFGAELFLVAPASEPLYRMYDANFDAVPNNYVGSIDTAEFTRIAGEIYSLELTRAFGDWEATLVGGHAKLAFENNADPDFGPAPTLVLIQKDHHPQTTFELRTSSPELDGLFGADLGTSNLTFGAFWQDRGFEDSEAGLRIDPTATAIFLAGNTLPLPVPPPLPGGVLPPNDPADDEIGIIYYDQNTRSAALFSQLEWSPIPSLMFQLGLRYSDEQKRAHWNSVSVQGTGLLARAALGREPYTADADRSEQQLSPKVLVRYSFSDDANVYLGWVKTFRAGGFNQLASTGDPAGLEYGEEEVRSWEGGGKLTLLDGAARLNIGLFWMTLDDFQVLTQDPSDVGYTVLNAGGARARGVEVDGLWLANDWLSWHGSLGFNDNEFVDFPFGTCAAGNEDTDGDGDERCNVSGEPLDFASRVTATLSPRAQFELPWLGIGLDVGIVAAYQSEYFADNALRDERVKQEGVTRWNAHIGIGSPDGSWRLRVVGENLSDEVVASYKSDVPLATDTFYQTLEPGRLIFGELIWNF